MKPFSSVLAPVTLFASLAHGTVAGQADKQFFHPSSEHYESSGVNSEKWAYRHSEIFPYDYGANIEFAGCDNDAPGSCRMNWQADIDKWKARVDQNLGRPQSPSVSTIGPSGSVTISALSFIDNDSKFLVSSTESGPNCYFTALSANGLAKVPAMTHSSASAALYFLNPALCEVVDKPRPGDLGLEVFRGALNHVYTYISRDLRFEKKGPMAALKMEFRKEVSSDATMYVKCHPMDQWIDQSTATLTERQQQIYNDVKRLEQFFDVRNRPLNGENKVEIIERSELISGQIAEVLPALQSRLATYGETISYPSGQDYLRLALKSPAILKDQNLFALMMLAQKLVNARDEYFASWWFPALKIWTSRDLTAEEKSKLELFEKNYQLNGL